MTAATATPVAAITHPQFADLPNGTRLHYASAGRRGAPLMLFVHGFPEFWYEWEAQLAAFGDTHFAVAPDMRGYNLSSKPAEVDAYRPKPLVQDLEQFIAALGYDSAIVVAHDWGGAICWNLAIQHPERVARLVIVNSPHPWVFANALLSDPAQQAASAYMNWLRQPGVEDVLAADGFDKLEGFFNGMGQPVAEWFTPDVRALPRRLEPAGRGRLARADRRDQLLPGFAAAPAGRRPGTGAHRPDAARSLCREGADARDLGREGHGAAGRAPQRAGALHSRPAHRAHSQRHALGGA